MNNHIESCDVTMRFADGLTIKVEGAWVESITRRDRKNFLGDDGMGMSILDLSLVGGMTYQETREGGQMEKRPITPANRRRLIDLGGS